LVHNEDNFEKLYRGKLHGRTDGQTDTALYARKSAMSVREVGQASCLAEYTVPMQL